MTAALIILAAIVVVGGMCLLYELHWRSRGGRDEPPSAQPDGECCGMHAVCERDSLLAAVDTAIEYFDDEELDASPRPTPTQRQRSSAACFSHCCQRMWLRGRVACSCGA